MLSIAHLVQQMSICHILVFYFKISSFPVSIFDGHSDVYHRFSTLFRLEIALRGTDLQLVKLV